LEGLEYFLLWCQRHILAIYFLHMGRYTTSISLFLVLFSYCKLSYAQVDGLIAIPPIQNDFFVDLSYSPILGFRNLSTNDRDLERAVVETRNELESPQYGHVYSAHVQLRHSEDRIKRISNYRGIIFESGIDYSNLNYLYAVDEFIGDLNDPLVPESLETIHNFQHIQIPLSFGFFATRNALTYYAKTGISANIKTQYSQIRTLYYKDGITTSNELELNVDYRPITYSIHFNLGIEYSPSQNLSIFAEPFFSRNIVAIADTPVKEYLWSTGARLGLRLYL
jgi:hypothetical protein